MDRLYTADATGGAAKNYDEDYTYDSTTGNLATKAGVTYTYGNAAHKHAVTSLSNGNTYQYDPNGNMTQRYANQQTYNFAYDAENHLTAVTGAAQAQFKYNGDGQRVVATEGITTTVFVGNYFELQFVNGSATQTTKYYYSGGARVAMQRGSLGVKYLLGDHLGSASVVLNADGTSLGAQGYRPWGSVNFTEGTIPTEYTFTGQYSYVSRFGMAYFNARWYLPELGRFSQPDTIIPEQQQGTIAWDRYAYVNNNSINAIDPSGHAAWYITGWNPAYVQKQVGNTCAPTALAVAFSILLGQKITLEMIKRHFPSTYVGIGVMPKDQADHADHIYPDQVDAIYSQGDRADLLNNLRNGWPTVVSVAWTNAVVGHALTVVGYDPATGEFLFFDPAQNAVITESQFQTLYKVTFDQAWLGQPNPAIPRGSMVTLKRKPKEPDPIPPDFPIGGGSPPGKPGMT